MAGNIKKAVAENKKMIPINDEIARQLEWEEQLPQRIQAVLQTTTVVPPRVDRAEPKLAVYFDRETRSYCKVQEVSNFVWHSLFAVFNA